jgi:hypothetical protein
MQWVDVQIECGPGQLYSVHDGIDDNGWKLEDREHRLSMCGGLHLGWDELCCMCGWEIQELAGLLSMHGLCEWLEPGQRGWGGGLWVPGWILSEWSIVHDVCRKHIQECHWIAGVRHVSSKLTIDGWSGILLVQRRV